MIDFQNDTLFIEAAINRIDLAKELTGCWLVCIVVGWPGCEAVIYER